jgi:hypothetical protein
MARALAAAALLLGACVSEAQPEGDPAKRSYGRTEVLVIDEDVVGVYAEMAGAADRAESADFARCVVSGYTLSKGYAFARHIRTNVTEEGGIWRADALYSVTPGVPEGLTRIDAEVTAADCALRGIPTA